MWSCSPHWLIIKNFNNSHKYLSRGITRLWTRCTVVEVGYLYCILVKGSIIKLKCIQNITLFTRYLLSSKNNYQKNLLQTSKQFFSRRFWQQVRRSLLFFSKMTAKPLVLDPFSWTFRLWTYNVFFLSKWRTLVHYTAAGGH